MKVGGESLVKKIRNYDFGESLRFMEKLGNLGEVEEE